MHDLMKRLLAYLCPGIVGDDEGALPDEGRDPGADGAPGDSGDADEFDLDDGSTPPADEDEDDEETPPAGQEGASPPSRAQGRIQRQAKELKETRARLAALEAQLRAQPSPPQGQHQPVDPDIAKLADPTLDPMERFRIEGNLAIRQSSQLAQQALAESRDISDRTAFSLKASSTPLFKKYADRVEEEVARMRKSGQQVPPREAIAKFLIGNDLAEGKLKPRARSAGESSSAAPRVANNGRGQPTRARSDVPPTRGRTEAQRREDRLRGKLI